MTKSELMALLKSPYSPEIAGEFMHFMMMSCAVSGLTMGVNPFNQPGVEAYKQKAKELYKMKSL
jgi:glucose-6-phosphate isomerase